MSDLGLVVITISLLIVGHGMFAMSATAVVTARKSTLRDWANRGNTRARTALELAGAPNRFVSAVQIVTTLIAILAGVVGGRSFADGVAAGLEVVPFIGPYGEAIALGLIVVAITYLTLIVGELVPKRLAMRHPETIAALVAVPLRLLVGILSPTIRLLAVSTDLVSYPFGRPRAEQPPVTEEEIKTLVQQGAEAGVFEESAHDMVEAVLRLGDRTARSLMTPRTQIAWLDPKSSIEEIREKIIRGGHSRFPVATGSLDQVVGLVQAKDLLALTLANKPIDFNTLMQQPLFVPRTISALELLESFKKSNKHIALVVDEYGGIEGLLTHHDILEAIAGDIPIGEKPADSKAVRRHDGSWLLDGMLSVDEFKEIFHVDAIPGEKRDAYQTLGGFVFTQMGRVPSVAESFEWRGLRFEIVDMDGKRIDKVLVVSKDAVSSANTTPDSGSVAQQKPQERDE
jgi:putative hemolysin